MISFNEKRRLRQKKAQPENCRKNLFFRHSIRKKKDSLALAKTALRLIPSGEVSHSPRLLDPDPARNQAQRRYSRRHYRCFIA